MQNKNNNVVIESFRSSIELKNKLIGSNLIDQIESAAASVVNCLLGNKKIFFAGNGGSFADYNNSW